MVIKQFDIWLADLNPRVGTETGKRRPVVIVQTNMLNRIGHSSILICPITTNIRIEAELLRIHLKAGEAGLQKDSDILIDQIRAIDNKRLVEKLGELSSKSSKLLIENLSLVLDLNPF